MSPGIGIEHELGVGADGAGDGEVVVGGVLVVVVGLVVPGVDVATGLLDSPGTGCGVRAGGAFG